MKYKKMCIDSFTKTGRLKCLTFYTPTKDDDGVDLPKGVKLRGGYIETADGNLEGYFES